MKICSLCKEKKPFSAFNKKTSAKDGLQNVCKLCSKKRFKEYYNANKEKHKKITCKRRDEESARVKKYIIQYLLTHPCVHCGETDIRVLEFDHLRDKVKAIGTMVQNNYSLKKVKLEIDKCQVLCSNCHAKKTASEYNWYTHKYLVENGLI